MVRQKVALLYEGQRWFALPDRSFQERSEFIHVPDTWISNCLFMDR